MGACSRRLHHAKNAMSGNGRDSGPPSIRSIVLLTSTAPRRLIAGLLVALCAICTTAAAAPILLQQFEGLSDFDNFPVSANPPDNALAVGPAHSVEMVNVVGRITYKAGGILLRFSLDAFFGVDPGFRGGDPRVIYDAKSGRWYATSMNFSRTMASSSIMLAVSTTNDPTGSFCRYRFGNPASAIFPCPATMTAIGGRTLPCGGQVMVAGTSLTRAMVRSA